MLTMAGLLVAATLWPLAMTGAGIRGVVEARIAEALQGNCRLGSLRWNGWNRVELRSLSVDARDWPESAREVIHVDSLRADFDPLALLWGQLDLRNVEADRVLVRAVERPVTINGRDGRELNVMKLELPEGGAGGAAPDVRVKDLQFEMGSLRPDGTVLQVGTRHYDGRLWRSPEGSAPWHASLVQTLPRAERPVQLTVDFSDEDFRYELTVSNFKLEPGLQSLLPEAGRHFWTQFGIAGSVDTLRLSGDKTRPVDTARLEVSDIDITLPIPGVESIWARYSDGKLEREQGAPQIHVTKGVFSFSKWRVEAVQIHGTITSSDPAARAATLPIEMTFWLDLERGRVQEWGTMPPEEWLESALALAPFQVRVDIPSYEINAVPGEPAPRLELPRTAAEILANFEVKEGAVSITATATRGDPAWPAGTGPGAAPPVVVPVPAEITATGEIYINRGTGGYFKFPYTLRDVQGHISFTDKVVSVDYLRGKGSRGAEISISGTVLEPGDDAGVDLRITAAKAPIDSVLEDSLRYSPAQQFLKVLFYRPAMESLLAAGLPARQVQQMRREREDLLGALSALPAAPAPGSAEAAERERLSRRLQQLAAVDWLQDFELGGWCKLDLNVKRAVRGGEHVTTTGRITLIETDALCKELPYPLHVLGRDVVGDEAATITVEDERILLPPGGLRLRLPGGGSGALEGVVEIPRGPDGERVVDPRVTVTTRNDSINDLLLAALPPSQPGDLHSPPPAGWPGAVHSTAAELLRAIGLAGDLDSTIRLAGDGRGGIGWSVRGELRHGTASPRASVGTELAESGLEWPEGFELTDCTASIEVDPTSARLVSFRGSRFDGVVTGFGETSLVDSRRSLSMAFHRIDLGEYLVNLLPQRQRKEGQDFWKDHRPEGTFSALLGWSQDVEGRRDRRLKMWTDGLSFDAVAPQGSVEGPARRRVTVTQEGGSLELHNRRVDVDHLTVMLAEEGIPGSRLRLDGAYGVPGDEERLELEGQWECGRLDSALLMETLSLVGADGAVAAARRTHPVGSVDAAFWTASDERGPDFRVSIEPRWVGATLDGAQAQLAFDGGRVTAAPGRVHLDQLFGRTPGGSFWLAGQLEGATADRIERGRLEMAFRGWNFGDAEAAFLPPRVRTAMQAVSLSLPGPVAVDDAVIAFERLPDGSYATSFDGVAQATGASFRSGIDFTELDVSARIHVPREGGAIMDLAAPRYRAAGWEVRDGAAHVTVTPGAGDVVVRDVTGFVSQGRASASAIVDLRDRRYSCAVALVGADMAGLQTSGAPGFGAGSSSQRAWSEGRLDGSLSIGGPLDVADSAEGRGLVSIRDGRMAELPLTMSILQLSQFMLPINTALDRGDIRFHVDGPTIQFERFDLTCATLQFIGQGHMDISTNEISLRFRNRGTLPVWSDLFGAVTDTLYAIDVTGTFAAPKVTVAPLPPLSPAGPAPQPRTVATGAQPSP